MQIKIINVAVTTMPAKGKGRPYSQAEVVYKNERDEPKTWKLVSFANPQVFEMLKDAKMNDTFEITVTKQGEFNQWVAASKSDGTVVADVREGFGKEGSKAESAAPKYTSTYETPAERAVKQRLIVRQSSLAQAIEYYKHPTLSEANVVEEDVIRIAETFADWVFQEPDLFDQMDDVPL